MNTSSDRRPRAHSSFGERVELRVPVELCEPLGELLPELVKKGVRLIDVFDYHRPGEASYWLVFLMTADGRRTVGTPDLRHLSLQEQVPELLVQLANWEPPALTALRDWA
jgi:hypothetical protein